jgi:uncharacterized protein
MLSVRQNNPKPIAYFGINVCSPNPVPNAVFMKAVRTNFGLPVGLNLSSWMLEFGAWVMGTETELITKSRRVVPTKLQKAGFGFDYPNVQRYFESVV